MAATIMQMEGSIVAPKDDAVMHEIFNEQAGVVRGCALTYMGTNQIKVGAGYIYACGRLIKIEEETVLSPFAADENGAEGELILKIDLLSDTPAKYIARTPRQELVQEDINGAGAVYEYLIASYTVTDVAISGLTIEYEVISAGFSKDKILTTLAEVEATTEPGFLPDALVVKELNSKKSIEIIWENNSPTSDFVSQKIMLDLTKFTAIMILGDGLATSNDHTKSRGMSPLFPIGYAGQWVSSNNYSGVCEGGIRVIEVDENGVSFSNAYTSGSFGASNSYGIPIKIYGIL